MALNKVFHQWLSYFDMCLPWLESQTYQRVILAQFSRPQWDLTCESIAFYTLCPQYFQTVFMDGIEIWEYGDYG